MTTDQSQQAKLDEVIRQARYLLFAFDGPIRSLSTDNHPAPYIHDVLSACRESGCSAVIITTAPIEEVRAYLDLDAHDMPTVINAVAPEIAEALGALEAPPADCAVITSSMGDIERAREAGVHTIVYAKTPDDAVRQAAAGATVIYSLADLALSLRARPL